MKIDQHTALYGVTGYPLGHSLSPLMHNAAFECCGVNAVFLAFETHDLEGCIRSVRALGIRGLSVTLPFKSEIIAYLDRLDSLAESIGAVNTVVNREGMLIGYNTDATGALRALSDIVDPRDKRCLILGAGGAARAIGFALKEQGCVLTIANRSRERGEALAQVLDASFVLMDQVKGLETDILIQTTPVGMYPQVEQCPMNPESVRAEVVMDIIYNPFRTELLKSFKRQGAKTIEGMRMFVCQGAEQFRLWTGLEPPIQTMEAAARISLAAEAVE